MSRIDLNELERVAGEATPGWILELPPAGEWSSRTAYVRAPSWGIVAHINLDPSLPHWDGPQRANAALIASMNPDTAKKLIAVVRAAQKALKALNALEYYEAPEGVVPDALEDLIFSLEPFLQEKEGKC